MAFTFPVLIQTHHHNGRIGLGRVVGGQFDRVVRQGRSHPQAQACHRCSRHAHELQHHLGGRSLLKMALCPFFRRAHAEERVALLEFLPQVDDQVAAHVQPAQAQCVQSELMRSGVRRRELKGHPGTEPRLDPFRQVAKPEDLR